MKRLVSMFLAATMFLGIGMNVQAGGVDKEETLKDGTKLIYISKENIPDAIKKYKAKCNELLDARYTDRKNLTIKGVAATLATAGFYVSSQLSKEYPAAAVCGQVLSVILGLTGFFYPDYRDYELGKEYGGGDSREGYSYKFGPSNAWGAFQIASWLNSFLEGNIDAKDFSQCNPESGVVIVIRPLSAKGNGLHSFSSGVYTQYCMENPWGDCEDSRTGLEILNICVEEGM